MDRRTTHEHVRETLRQAILSGELPGGTRLVQAEIAKDLGVSITPVREALRDLANEQMIRLDAHRGGIVHELSDSELREILDLRLLLETEAVRHAAERITPAQLSRARAIHHEMRSVGDSPSWVMLNRRFHMTIYEAAGRPRLLGIVRNLLDASVMYVSAADAHVPRHRRRANDDHARLLRLLREHDVEGAVDALRRHIEIPRSVLAARS
ncbi:MAG TPA: GntR family transcriptional regulator [Acidimicrobiales bacterium]|nr:GntR family transcriptional regulator [Acidimicrobiales bacterium]